jgi:xylulokinase
MSLLAIDIGSSQCKAAVFTAAGAMIARSVCCYSPDFPQPTFAEMDPAKFWNAVCETSREVTRNLGKDPARALCLSAHGETLIPVDAKCEPVGPAILNMDNWPRTRCIRSRKFSGCAIIGPSSILRPTGF